MAGWGAHRFLFPALLLAAMKYYTRTGDKGTSGLVGGKRVPKHHLRLEASGTVDELNSCLGWTWCALKQERARKVIERVQSELFELGADLAAPFDSKNRDALRLPPHYVKGLERDIDSFSREIPDLRKFVVPAGTEGALRLHVCRSVARRAERRVSALAEKEKVNGEVLRYLNRLSSLLFVLARWCNKKARVKERVWKGR